MSKKIISLLMKLTSVVLVMSMSISPSSAWAQAQGLTSGEKAELTGTRKQLATIIFAGLSGAILGMSTLSFYGRPQAHLSNIAVGLAVGIIGGAVFTTYKAATRPYEAYDLSQGLFEDEATKRIFSRDVSQFHPIAGWQWDF